MNSQYPTFRLVVSDGDEDRDVITDFAYHDEALAAFRRASRNVGKPGCENVTVWECIGGEINRKMYECDESFSADDEPEDARDTALDEQGYSY